MSASSSPSSGRTDAGVQGPAARAFRAPLLAVPRADDPAIGGIVPFSSLDYPDRLAAVVFIAGCPWRCHYCHNPHLQRRHGAYRWDDVLDFLRGRAGLLDAVVFSGGEPLSEPRLPALIADIRALGFGAALHTAGIYPRRLRQVLPLLDWVGFDVKTRGEDYDTLTGKRRAYQAMDRSLDLLLAAGVPFECRTTWDAAWLDEERLFDLAQDLRDRGVKSYAVQAYRRAPGALPTAALSPAMRLRLAACFDSFTYRQ